MRCQLVAQELCFGEWLCRLSAGTPSQLILELLLCMVVERDILLMRLDVK